MLRRALAARAGGGQDDFRWRGTDVSRMEGFSDGVFGFAVTLLVVSLDVPDTYDQLAAALRHTPSFAVCFALLLLVWRAHYRFFRRYGLEDPLTIGLNAALLFVVLVYVYPLKFLFTELTDVVLGIDTAVARADGTRGPPITAAQWPGLLAVYAAGYLAINACFVLLYLNAWRRRERLALTPAERLATRAEVLALLANLGAGGVALAFALGGAAPLAGLSFALQWPFRWLADRYVAGRRRALAAAAPAPAATSATVRRS
jgi:hypothetical protein